MKANKAIELLKHHPYFEQLNDTDKMVVLNFALIDYWNFKEEEIYPGLMPAGVIGEDGLELTYPDIYKLPQRFSGMLSLSKYSDISEELNENDLFKDFTEEQRRAIFYIAVSKIARSIPESYSVENHSGDFEYETPDIVFEVTTEGKLLKNVKIDIHDGGNEAPIKKDDVLVFGIKSNLDVSPSANLYSPHKVISTMNLVVDGLVKDIHISESLVSTLSLEVNGKLSTLVKDASASFEMLETEGLVRSSATEPHMIEDKTGTLPELDIFYTLFENIT